MFVTWLLLIGSLALTGCEKKGEKISAKPGEESPHPSSTMSQIPAAPVDVKGMVTVGPLTGKIPQGWRSVPPATSMRKADFLIGGEDGESIPAIVSAFYFGPSAGSIEMNIERWVAQFTQPDGSPLDPSMITRETFTVNDMEVTVVSFAGTQLPSNMAGGVRIHEMPGWRNLSGIVMTPEGPWFFKGTGPDDLLRGEHRGFIEFLKSMTYSESASSAE